MALKENLINEAKSLGLNLRGDETNAELQQSIDSFKTANQTSTQDSAVKPEDNTPSEPSVVIPTPTRKDPQAPQMVPLSDVKRLIAEALAAQAEDSKPVKVKKVTEHLAHVYRMDGKWVTDFKDRNYDYENNRKIDEYIKEKIHAYNVWNPNKRENEAWIEVVFQDGTSKEIPLNRYVERRTLVYCKIIKRHKVDKSYTIGEVEKKDWVNDRQVGTGVIIDQDVNMHQEVFEVETPDKQILTLPEYVIC